MNVNSTEAELFAMKLQDVSKVVVITDAIPAAKWIFNTSIYPYQLHFITILENLREFFNKNPNNSISFWDYPNNIKWSPHVIVNKELKYIKTNSILPSRTFWEFSRKEEYNSIIHRWQMTFQVSDCKGRNFLDLNDDKEVYICLTYVKEGA